MKSDGRDNGTVCRVVQHGRAAVSAERRTDVEQSRFESGHGNNSLAGLQEEVHNHPSCEGRMILF